MLSPTPRTVRAGATAAAVLAAFALPGVANASSIKIDKPGSLVYQAVAGETNHVQVTEVDSDKYQSAVDLGPAVKIRDTSLSGPTKISATAPCQQIDATGKTVLCPIGTGPAALTSLVINLGDQNDSALVHQDADPFPNEHPLRASIVTTLNGEDGNDALVGGAADDIINGGAGDDVFFGGFGADHLNGGDGSDTATYELATDAVTASLDGQANDGAVGGTEGDAIAADVENLTGTPANDTLTGDANANTINGLAGDDTITGGDGADAITCGDGNDTAFTDALDAPTVDCELLNPGSDDGSGGDDGTGGGGGNTGGGGGGSTTTTGDSTATESSASNDTSAPLPQQQAQLHQEAVQQDRSAASRTVTVQRSAVRLSHGVAKVRISVPAAMTGTLRLVLPLTHGKQLTLGKASFATTAGQRKVVTVRLSRAGRRAIQRRGGATVLAIVKATDASGNATSSRSGFLLKVR